MSTYLGKDGPLRWDSSAALFAKYEKTHCNPNAPLVQRSSQNMKKLWQPKNLLVQRSSQNMRKPMATQIPPNLSSATQFAKYDTSTVLAFSSRDQR